jgi:hypothetical protein
MSSIAGTAKGSAMNDKGLEAPDADIAEQEQDVIPVPDDIDEVPEIPLEAPDADAAEQAREVNADDDDYR